MDNLEKFTLQQQILEETFRLLVEQQQSSIELMHNMLVKNRQVLEGIDPYADDTLPVVQIEAPEEEIFFIGQQLKVNGFDVTVCNIDKHSLGVKAILIELDGVSTKIQDIVVPRDLALRALKAEQDALLAADDAKDE